MQKRWPGSTGRKNALAALATELATDAHGGWILARELALDEFRQAAERLEGRRANLVVVDREAEMLLQRRDQVDDGDRVELRDGAEQRRSLVHALNAVRDLQRAAHQHFHIVQNHRCASRILRFADR